MYHGNTYFETNALQSYPRNQKGWMRSRLMILQCLDTNPISECRFAL